MKRAALITATLFAAAFATSAAQALAGTDESGEVFTMYDASASAPDPANVPQEVKDLREKVIADTLEQMNVDSKYGGE
jgi:hypothetical protein